MSDFAKDTNVPTNDCISRKAAIDMVLKYAKRLREPIGTPEDNEMYSYGRGLLVGIGRNLKQLPSAQPEPITAYWKKDCFGAVFCSKCGGIRRDNRVGHVQWCNSCGCFMRGEQEGEEK